MAEEDVRAEAGEAGLEIEEIGGRDPEAGEAPGGGDDEAHPAGRRLALAVPQPVQVDAADGPEAQKRREMPRPRLDARGPELHEPEERAQAGQGVVARVHLSGSDGWEELPTCDFADSRYT